MESLESMLGEQEADFVRRVFLNPKGKIQDITHWEDDGSEYGKTVFLYAKPENLGLIECVGSYKWIPTDKLAIGVKK